MGPAANRAGPGRRRLPRCTGNRTGTAGEPGHRPAYFWLREPVGTGVPAHRVPAPPGARPPARDGRGEGPAAGGGDADRGGGGDRAAVGRTVVPRARADPTA